MDQCKTTDNNSSSASGQPSINRLHNSHAETRQMQGVEMKDPTAARKVHKADREKLRRDRVNEYFLKLGQTLDPDRPKNDKATILTDTVQVLKDLTAEVSKLKAEYSAFSEESRELMQEKNELREEKTSLKSDIENLNLQYQQRLRVVYPWASIDPSLVMGPAPTYSYPVPVAMPPPGAIPMHHPSLQPFPNFFGNQNPSSMASPCSTFIPYPTPLNPAIEQQSVVQYASSSHVSGKLDSKSKSSNRQRGRNTKQNEDSNDVATELELKMPGSSSVPQDLASGGKKKGKQTQRKEKSSLGSSSSGLSSSRTSPQEGSSSDSVGDAPAPPLSSK